jgi:hypothetical protein
MNTKIIPFITALGLLSLVFYSCEDSSYLEYKGNEPVYISYEDLRASVKTTENTDLKNPGKIYYKDDYIFIIEELKGIHVFDNKNPSSPLKLKFVSIPGVIDMAISGNILYADSYVDLVVLDVQDIQNIHEVGRVPDILPYTVPPTGNEFPKGNIDRTKGLVLKWELKTIKERVVPNRIVYPDFETNYLKDMLSSSQITSGVSSSGTGIGGSMARFGIKDNILYLLDGSNINLLDITVKGTPALLSEKYAGGGIETMFISGNSMFLGTTTGLLIYDITNPLTLVKKSSYNHVRSCDPVVVDDTLAYVTLRNGGPCGIATSSLDVVNIKNLSAPVLVRSYPMTNPYGLGKHGDLLFICDGTAGLKIYNASNARNISSNLIYSYPDIKAFDAIPIGNILLLIGDDGLYQYNYSNIQNITLMSSILVVK